MSLPFPFPTLSAQASALLAAAAGWGTVSEAGSEYVPSAIAIDNSQIVTNVFLDPSCKPSSTQVCTVVSKRVECIYSVTVDFGNSGVILKTGPPGALGKPASQRCWLFTMGSGNAGYTRGALNAPCPTIPQATGNLTGFSATLPAQYSATCDGSSGSTIPSTAVGAVGGGVWLQPNMFAHMEQAADPFATIWCLTKSSTAGSASTGSSGSGDSISTMASNQGCLAVQTTFSASVISYTFTSGTCPTTIYTAPPTTGNRIAITTFPNAPAPAAASTTSASQAKAWPTKAESVTVLSYSISMTGLTNPALIADPCTAFPLRQETAKAAGVAGISTSNIILSGVRAGSTVLAIPPTAAANTATSTAGCARRLLRSGAGAEFAEEPQFELVEGRDYIVLTGDAATEMARRLQPSGGSGIGVQIAPPAGTTAAQLSSSISTTAPTVSGIAGLSGVTVSAVSSPTTANVTLQVPVVFPPRIDPYVVDPLVVQYHSIPRKCLASCDGVADNNFALNATYGQGAVAIGAGMFALAVLVILIYPISYCCGLCACTSCRCRRKRDPAQITAICSPRTVYLIFGVINIALVLSVLSYLGRFPTGIKQLLDGINDFSTLITTAGRYLGDPTCEGSKAPIGASPCEKLPNLDVDQEGKKTALAISFPRILSVFGAGKSAQDAVATLNGFCPSGGSCPSAVTSIISAIGKGMSSSVDLGDSTGSMLGNLGGTLTTILSGLPISIDQIRSTLMTAGYGVLGLLAGWIFIFTFTVCRNSCMCFVHGASAMPTILLTFLICILAGIFYILGIVGADICYDPYMVIQRLGSSVGLSGGMIGDTLTYYLTCGANPATPRMGALTMVDDAIGMVGTAAAQVTALQEQVKTASSQSPLYALQGPAHDSAAMKKLDDGVQMTVASIKSIVSLLGCQGIDAILSKLFTGFCTNTIATVIGISRILIAASIMLFLQLGVGIDMCCFHPGLTSRYLSEEEVLAKESGGASQTVLASSSHKVAPMPRGGGHSVV